MARGDHNTRVKIVEDRSLFRRENTTQFNQSKAVLKTPQLVLNSDLPLSERRDEITTQNNATIQKIGSEYRLRATADANSFANLRTRQRGNYLSGSVLEAGLGVRIPEQPAGDAYIRWGYFGDNDGLFWEYDSTGLYIVVRKNGTDNRVRQKDWNLDTLDGTRDQNNPSGIGFDPADGAIYQIPFAYYGYGAIDFEVGLALSDNDYEVKSVHQQNMRGETSVDEPNQPIAIEVDSGTSGQQLDVFVGGRQISPLGTNDNTSRSVSAYRLSQTVTNGTSFAPLISFRIKSGFEQIFTRLSGFTIITDADLVCEIHRNATLSGASFITPQNHVADEIGTEWDISAGATYTAGETMYAKLIDGGTGTSVATFSELPNRPVSELDVYTLATRRISGTNNYTVSSLFRVNEDW